MKFLRDTTWEEVFNGWRGREASNPAWIACATKVKGWPDWESWRRFTASQIDAESRVWKIFKITDPMKEIQEMFIGPFSGWQSRIINKNNTTFRELIDIPEQYHHFSTHDGVVSILKGLPFTTEFIGILREDRDKIVLLEGHHRATAIAIVAKEKRQIDFENVNITMALARLPADECPMLDDILKRGTSKNIQV